MASCSILVYLAFSKEVIAIFKLNLARNLDKYFKNVIPIFAGLE